MTNKEKLKKAIEHDINPKDYYNKIISQIEKGEKRNMKKSIWKWSLVPICMIIVIGGILFINYQNNKAILQNKSYIDKKNNVTLNINEINNKTGGTYKIDADIKVVTNNDVNFPLPYKNGLVKIPKDLDKTDKYIYYFREDKESKDYNILGNYEIIYSNDYDKSINVKYSKDHKPVRDYGFSEEGSKTTIINNTELKIYKYENIYFTEFKFNGYNFDIESSNITEQELSNFLISILK